MKAADFDVIVVGVGAMGSAAAWQLAARGLRVLGLERHTVGHALGSSHGESRLIRQAYFEHPAYVPLLRRAYELWSELEAGAGRPLLHLQGLVIYGPRDGVIMAGVRASSAQYGIPVTGYDAGTAATIHPEFRPPTGYEALYEPDAGYLDVEDCVIAQAAAARRHGAVIKERETVLNVDNTADGVVVTTNSGTYKARHAVITAGAWSADFLTKIRSKLAVHRVPLVWFDGDARYAAATGLPCFAFELPTGFFYGMPDIGGRGVKIGLHKPGDAVKDPATLDRTLRPDDVAPLATFIQACMPGVDPRPRGHAICMYTMSPDEHFILDTDRSITYAAGFSGHGFKFAPVIGEVLADLATTGKTAHPIDFLRPRWS